MEKTSKPQPSQPSSHEIAQLAAELGLDKKGDEIVILDLRKFAIGCEYFVIMTGTSEPHVRALAGSIEEALERRLGQKPWHREGLQKARWILLDYVDCVVHVLDGEARQYYMLERLWGDAPRERIGFEPAAAGGEDDGPESPSTDGAEDTRDV